MDKTLAAVKRAGFKIFERPHELNIVGVRSANTRANAFDDKIHVSYRDGTGRWVSHNWPCTTDPGTYWLRSPMNSKGTAILKGNMQYVGAYGIGLHRGKYKALCQINGPVTVIRDYNRDDYLDFMNGSEARGSFGINIHHASSHGTTKTVDKYSAGCQVFANIEDFGAFMALCERHRELYGNKFTYTLLDERALARGSRRKLAYAGGLFAAVSLMAALAWGTDND
jgi:hypothetical protein